MKIITRVPGKLIITGEYAVLEGSASLVMTVNRFARVELALSDEMTFTLQAPSIGVHHIKFSVDSHGRINFLHDLSPRLAKKLKFFVSIFEHGIHLLKKGKRAIRPSELLMDTDAFFHHDRSIKLGLGSSAALTVALIASLLAGAEQISPDKNEIFQLALQAHRAAQGNLGSGIDIAASVYGGLLCYKIDPMAENLNPQISRLNFPENLHLLPVWVGKCSSTSQFVKLFNDFKKEEKHKFGSFIQEMKTASESCCHAFRNGQIGDFLSEINQYHLLMNKLGELIGAQIITKEHQKVAEIVRAAGGAYKPSGAGGGDIGICFSDDYDMLADLKKEIKKAGFEPLDLKFENNGLETKLMKVETSEIIAHT